MKLFSSTRISWSEPWFFLLRIRERQGWLRRAGLAILIAVVMFVAMHFLDNGRRGAPESIAIAVAIGLVLVAAMDLPNIQRDVTFSDDSVTISSTAGRGRFTTFKYSDIDAIEIVRREEWKYGWSGLIIDSDNDGFLIAVPEKVALETIANILHRLEIPVSLSGWTPSNSDTRISVRNELEIDPERVVGHLSMNKLEDSEPRLMTPAQIGIQLIIALGPLLVSLVGSVIAGIHLYRNWAGLSILNRCLIGGGALALIVVSVLYLIRIGQFVAASYGIRCARNRLRMRGNSPFSGEETGLFTVELFDREKWTAAAMMSDDFGFMQVDKSKRLLTFEGNKTRWSLPASAISAYRIEESTVGTEGNSNAEKRYFVVIETTDGEEPWQTGMVYTRTETGADGPEQRYARSQLLFTQVAEVLN